MQYTTSELFLKSFLQHEHLIVSVRLHEHRRVEKKGSFEGGSNTDLRVMNNEEVFDYDGAYWKRIKGLPVPPTVLNELYEHSNEDPYSFLNVKIEEKHKVECDKLFVEESFKIKKNNENLDCKYFKVSVICKNLYCINYNVFKETLMTLSIYVV